MSLSLPELPLIHAHSGGMEYLLTKRIDQNGFALIVCPNSSDIWQVISNLQFFAPGVPVLPFRPHEHLPFEHVSPDPLVIAEHFAALYHIHEGIPSVIVTACPALLQRHLPLEALPTQILSLSIDQDCDLETLEHSVRSLGYREARFVEEPGEACFKGRVIDVFSPLHDAPFRIEHSAGKILRLTSFEPESQRSIRNENSLILIPARSSAAIPDQSTIHSLCDAIEAGAVQHETPISELREFLDVLKQKEFPPGFESFLPLLFPCCSLLEALPRGKSQVFLIQPSAIEAKLTEYADSIESRFDRLSAGQHLVPPKEGNFASLSELSSSLAQHSSVFSLGAGEFYGASDAANEKDSTDIQELEWLGVALKSKYRKGRSLLPLKESVELWKQQNLAIAFIANSEARVRRVSAMLNEIDVDFVDERERSFSSWIDSTDPRAISILQGFDAPGFVSKEGSFVLVTERELFGERSYRRESPSPEVNLKRLLSSLSELNPNDHVVHRDFGIGLYHGLEQRSVDGHMTDLLKIEYADTMLFLPVQQIGKVQQFVGVDGSEPRLDRLGSGSWQKTKRKVKQAVVALAGDLIRLYAQRDASTGYSYASVNLDDDQFADNFPYNETADQLKSIEEILSDMHRERPMDRLVCGDVGFGKTEVAMRAVFKCLQHSRQVTVLAPTTILVQQHFRSFEQRFKDYPFTVASVSRFNSSQENKQTLQKLAAGEVDVIIGTHRLLQKDVFFKNLGLLVIDEEHRFGVKHKERLKHIRKDVDVLTLTATPIPRTLHMSLLDIRDISVISTPPVDRLSVKTYVAKRDEDLIRDAILREHNRGGQSFFVHNRVETIATISEGLRELLPELRVEYAHGQMKESQLEPIMRAFLNKEIDVLVATTIIESGIDVPSANTILIDRADMLGLAQLYQLRGRVGRSNQQAFCYFLAPDFRKLNRDARERLSALQSLDSLGVGFHLALRDLEIRGAGNILGKEQSGNIAAVGYELYMNIIKETITEMRKSGESADLTDPDLDALDPEIRAEFEAFIPEDYVPDVSERLILYQRLAGIQTLEDAEHIRSEVQDRYGRLSEEVENVISLMLVRAILRAHRIVQLEHRGEKLLISFSPRMKIDPNRIIALAKKRSEMRISANQSVLINLTEPEKLRNPEGLRRYVESFLKELA